MPAKIIEIFSSIQGEGLWVGKPQTFVRFKGCKLKCTYCDTPLTHMKIFESRIEYPPYSKNFEKHALEFSVDEINETIKRFNIPSIAVTGGEPLEQVDFLEEWFPTLKNQGYDVLLETSGVEAEALKRVVDFVDLVSLDIKIPSATGEKSYWQEHQQFLRIACKTNCYAKVVFDEKITADEISQIIFLMKEFPTVTLVLQPISPLQKRDMKKIFEIFQEFSNQLPTQTRLIPQVHKFLGVF